MVDLYNRNPAPIAFVQNFNNNINAQSPALGAPGTAVPISLRLDYDHRTGVFAAWYAAGPNTTNGGAYAGPWSLLVQWKDTAGNGASASITAPAPFDALRLGIYAKSWTGLKMSCAIDHFSLRAVGNTPLSPWTPPGYANPPAVLPPVPPPVVVVAEAGATTLSLPLGPDVMWSVGAAAVGASGGGAPAAAPLPGTNGTCLTLFVTPDYDRGGFDLGGFKAGSVSACASLCCTTSMCFGFVWVSSSPGAFYQCTLGAPCCYLKAAGSVQSTVPYGAPGIMFSGLISRTTPAFLASPNGANATAGLPALHPGIAFPNADPSLAACTPRALAGVPALAPDAAALRYHVDFGGPRVRHCAPTGAGVAYTPLLASSFTYITAYNPEGGDTPWFKDCVGGTYLASYCMSCGPGTSTYAWAWFSAYDTSALLPSAPGRWLDSQWKTQGPNAAALANFNMMTPYAAVANQQGWLDPVGYSWDFVVVLSLPPSSVANTAPMVAFSAGGEPGSCGWALGALPGGAGLFFYAAGGDGASRAGAWWPAPGGVLPLGQPLVVHASIRYAPAGTSGAATNASAAGGGPDGLPVTSCAPASPALPPTLGFDFAPAFTALVAYVERGGIAACAAACCANVVCSFFTFAPTAQAGLAAACAVGAPCCVLRSTMPLLGTGVGGAPIPLLTPLTSYVGGIWVGGVARTFSALQCPAASASGPSRDAPGNDLGNHVQSGGLASCQAACCNHPRCEFITFAPNVAQAYGPCPIGSNCCWLKWGAPAVITNTNLPNGIWSGPVPKPARSVSLFVNGAAGVAGLPASAAPWAAPQGAELNGLTSSFCPSTSSAFWWPVVGCNLKTTWPRVITNTVTSPYCWRGQIFEALSFRGGAPPESALSEAGRAALTPSLLAKYRVWCPPLLSGNAGTNVIVANATAASCAKGAPFGGACKLACAPGFSPLYGAFNVKCGLGGTWSAPPLVCAPSPSFCAAGAFTIPPYATCAAVLLNETWGGGAARVAGAWNFSGSYPFFSGADKGVFFTPTDSANIMSLQGELLALPNPWAPTPPLAALHTGIDAWAPSGAGGASSTVSALWRPLRGASGIVLGWGSSASHVRIRSTVAVPAGAADGSNLPSDLLIEAVAPFAAPLPTAYGLRADSAVRVLAVADLTASPLGGDASPYLLSATVAGSTLTVTLRAGASGGGAVLATLVATDPALLDVASFGVGVLLFGSGAKAQWGRFTASVACGGGAPSPPLLGGQALSFGCPDGMMASGSPLLVCGSGGVGAPFLCTSPQLAPEPPCLTGSASPSISAVGTPSPTGASSASGSATGSLSVSASLSSSGAPSPSPTAGAGTLSGSNSASGFSTTTASAAPSPSTLGSTTTTASAAPTVSTTGTVSGAPPPTATGSANGSMSGTASDAGTASASSAATASVSGSVTAEATATASGSAAGTGTASSAPTAVTSIAAPYACRQHGVHHKRRSECNGGALSRQQLPFDPRYFWPSAG